MRIIAAAILAFLPLAAQAVPGAQKGAEAAPPGLDSMDASRQKPGCVPILQQVAGANRRIPETRLDRQPPGRALLAVDRQVDGCHEVTFAGERRARR